nr:hypothetical protein DSAG12_03393 [Candidatus Prometheoarchaeum syntrophicum]
MCYVIMVFNMKTKNIKAKLLVSGLILVILVTNVPFSQATADIRPIEDWNVNNPYGAPGFADAVNVLHFNWDEQIYDCDFSGFVLEQVVGEGRVKLSINLQVDEVRCVVHTRQPGWWMYPPIFDGRGWYNFYWVFEYNAEPGDPIPNIWDIYGIPELELEEKIMKMTGKAKDSEGATVFINQIGMFKPDYTGNAPHNYPYGFWPVEIIRLKL